MTYFRLSGIAQNAKISRAETKKHRRKCENCHFLLIFAFMGIEELLKRSFEELEKRGVSKVELSKKLGITYSSLHRKLSGEVRFTVPEYFTIVYESGYKLLIIKGETDEITRNS